MTEYSDVLLKSAMTHKLTADEAEEVVQDTWSDFFAQIDRFEGRSHVRTYLIGILYNKVKELFRKKERMVFCENGPEDFTATPGSTYWQSRPATPDKRLGFKQTLGSLQTALNTLPPQQKLALFLKEVESESTEHICEVMGITRENLAVLIFRAKNHLRAYLYDQETNKKSKKPSASYKEFLADT